MDKLWHDEMPLTTRRFLGGSLTVCLRKPGWVHQPTQPPGRPGGHVGVKQRWARWFLDSSLTLSEGTAATPSALSALSASNVPRAPCPFHLHASLMGPHPLETILKSFPLLSCPSRMPAHSRCSFCSDALSLSSGPL